MKRKITQLIAIVLLAIPLLTNSAPKNFEKAKVELKEKVYFDQNQGGEGTAYCGCDWKWVGRSGGRIDLESCNYKIRSPHSQAAVARAERTEVEHVLAISTIANKRQCWKQGGRNHCRKVDPIFNEIEADLHGLLYIGGEINSDASNYPMGAISGHENMYSNQCQTKVDFKNRLLEPQDSAKGRVARATFYGADSYLVQLSEKQQRLLMQWHRDFPATQNERMIERRAAKVMGHSNPYVTGDKQWKLGMQLEGKQLKTLNAKYPQFAEDEHGQRNPYQSRQPANQPRYQQAQQHNTNSQAGAATTGIKGNSNSKIYHLQSCPNFNDVNPRNSVYFKSENEATNKGYRKARNC